MKNGKHQIRGILFIAACVLIALLAHVAISQGYVERADTSGSVIENADAFADNLDNMADETQTAVADQQTTAPTSDALADTQELAENSPDDGCFGTVRQQVAAIDDPSAMLKPGERWGDITQYWRNERTGDTWWCAHGDNCFPASVLVNGQLQPTIELMDCAYAADRPEQEGDEIMYSVERIRS